MKYIDTTNLRAWATRRDCQDQLPLLVRKLIRATSASIKNISFPAGENVLIGGWDGLLEVYEETEYLPLGTSLWEFGTNTDIKGKADSDYEKRTANAIGFNPAEATYIFVTPRLWTKKDQWIDQKKAEGHWKDVRVYDAQTLEEWIEIAPSVGAWLAVNHLNIFPKDVQAADDFWDEWSTGNKIRFVPKVVLAGRNKQIERLFQQSKEPSIIPVKASSREEAIAFVVAAFKDDDQLAEDFFARALIVENPDAFREVILVDKPLFLIVRFEDDNVTNRAKNKGHIVYVPLGIDNSGQWSDKIDLPALEREAFLSALVESGLKPDTAEKVSKQSARNLAVLRRQLEFNRLVPEWALPKNVRDMIPALFAQRWDESKEEDRKIIEMLAGEDYNTYTVRLKQWLYTADAPLVKIGGTWRLTSPLDAWTNAGKYCTRADFEKLQDLFLKVFSLPDPKFALPSEEQHRASWYGIQRVHSRWLREGLVQTMILISVYGDRIGIDLPASAESWVDHHISTLLASESPELWKSIDTELPLLAEASPASFIARLEELLKLDNGPVHQLFEEQKGFLHSNSHHTGLLWALENLAWMPAYLTRVSLVLARLSEIDPGGALVNRPINSLRAIFKSWFPQTLATLDNRLTALKVILKSHSEIGRLIIKSLLPTGSGTASPTHRMRWRLSNETIIDGVTYEDLFKTHSQAIDLWLEFFDLTEESFNQLVEKSFDLNQSERVKVLDFVEQNVEKVEHTKHKTWDTLRKTIGRHRSYPDADWALPEPILDHYEKIYNLLTPADPVEQTSWVLKEQWPQSMTGKMRKLSHEEKVKFVHEQKVEAVKSIHRTYGLDKIFEICKDLSGAELQPLAFAAADVIGDQKDLHRIWEGLKSEDYTRDFAQFFIDRKKRINGNSFLFDLYEDLKSKGFDSPALSRIFLFVRADKEIWDFIDKKDKNLVDGYWTKINSFFFYLSLDDLIIGIKRLMEYQRFTSALYLASSTDDKLDGGLLVDILMKFITSEPEKDAHLNGYEIEHVINELRKRDDIPHDDLIKLEWLYLPFLNQGYNHSNTPILHQEMVSNSSFFMQVLEQLYKTDSDDQEDTELSEEQKHQKAMMAQSAYKLLDTLHLIPGTNKDWQIDGDKLKKWVGEVRELAKLSNRLTSAEAQIGSVFAHYPETNQRMEGDKELNWPPDILCEIMEEIASEAMFDNFRTSTYNKRGFSSRGPFDGGAREWHISTYFRKLAELKAPNYPHVAAILEGLAKSYEGQAKEEDERAERDKLDY